MTMNPGSASPAARPYATADLLTPIGDGEAALKLLHMLATREDKVDPAALVMIADGFRTALRAMRKIVVDLEAQPLPTPDAMDRMHDRLSALEEMTERVKAARTAPVIDRDDIQHRLHEIAVLAASGDEALEGVLYMEGELPNVMERATRAHTLLGMIARHASAAIDALETPASKEAAQ